VRVRLEQHCFIFGADVNDAYNARWGCSNRNYAGIYRDRQSRGELRGSSANGERIAVCTYDGTGTDDTNRYLSAYRFILVYADEPFPLPDRRDVERCQRLLKPPFTP